MADPYGHTHPHQQQHPHPHSFHESVGNVRHVAPNEYRMLVDDPAEDAGTLGLVHSQASDVHHEQMMKYQYVGHGDDELDFT